MKKNKTFKQFFLVITVTFFIYSCTKYNYANDHPKTQVVVPVPVTDTCKSNVKYNPQIKRILDLNCCISGCHDGVDHSDLRTYDLAKTNASSIIQRAYTEKTMPVDINGDIKALTNQCDLDKIKAWVDNGMPEN